MWGLYLILGMFPALILFAAIYKYVEVLQARRWSSVPGRVVISKPEGRSVNTSNSNSDDTELRNFANVVFEYKIAGRTYRNNRVSIGEDMGNSEVAETLARYPVGKAVTVFYNPNRREQSVLERELPPFLWKGIAIIILVLVGLIVGGVVGFSRLGDFVRASIPNAAEAPFVTACIGFASVFALFVFGFQRAAARAHHWPIAPGRVESSDVHAFESRDTSSGGSGRWSTQYRPEIIYSYEVAGVRYTGDKAVTGGRISSNVEAMARRAAAAYPAGRTLEVHYNPNNPADSVIDPGSRWIWLLYIVPAALLTLAYYVSR